VLQQFVEITDHEWGMARGQKAVSIADALASQNRRKKKYTGTGLSLIPYKKYL
jgi:hypothetical protein